MYKIRISGAEKASLAATWTKEHVSSPWDMRLESLTFSAVYIFSFNDETSASQFALKWI